ncbi:MAG: hypothetical protein JWM10_1971 [Myxococcaceae bacterium]|nr:hypothetical protein [Myxococcaceae bacterium]
MPTDDRQLRYTAAWRALAGLRPLDHPAFASVARVWRVELHPTFHDDVVITVTDVDAGGWIELRVVPLAARQWAMAEAGYGVAAPMGPPPAPRVAEATVPADALDALAAAMPRLPLHTAPNGGGRDGIFVDCEALLDGAAHRFAWWAPPPTPSPLHRAYTTSLCALAVARITDPAAVAAVQALAPYFR